MRRPGTDRGFTLVELMAVMVIIAIMMVSIVPALDNLLPSYRLRAAARTIAGNIELAQSEAIGQRREFVIEYNLDNQTYRLIIPPQEVYEQDQQAADEASQPALDPNAALDPNDPKAKQPNRPVNDVEHGAPPPDPAATPTTEETPAAQPDDYEQRQSTDPVRLPDDVKFNMIVVGTEEKRTGSVYVPFTHTGSDGAHLVGLKLERPSDDGSPSELWIRFNPMTRTITYSETRPEIKTLEPDAGGGSR